MNDIYRDNRIAKGRLRLTEIRAWRDRAVADGWRIVPTYQNETIDQAAKLHHPEGFTASILTRDYSNASPPYGAHRIEASLAVWGPDGLNIRTDTSYDMNKIRAGLRTCNACGADDIDTFLYSFAGRCCSACLPEMRRKHEKPGWDR